MWATGDKNHEGPNDKGATTRSTATVEGARKCCEGECEADPKTWLRAAGLEVFGLTFWWHWTGGHDAKERAIDGCGCRFSVSGQALRNGITVDAQIAPWLEVARDCSCNMTLAIRISATLSNRFSATELDQCTSAFPTSVIEPLFIAEQSTTRSIQKIVVFLFPG